MDIGENGYRRFLEGDDEGLTLIIKEYKDGLILYINSFVNNLYIAEDLMQETFLKLAIKKPKFKGKSAFKTWLYSISRNLTIDYLRRNVKMPVLSIDDMELCVKDETDLENAYIQSERKVRLHKILTTLKAEYRQVLWLVYFEEFSNDEVAQVLHKSKKQVENLIFRAKKSLKLALEKENVTDEEL